MKENMISCQDLSFSYESNQVLKNINFKINLGELVLIVGGSGSGKSTLLNLINGIIPEVIEGKMSGEILVKRMNHLKIYEKSQLIGNVFQNPRSQFFTTNTTAELVFQMENLGLSKLEMESRLDALIEKFNIRHLLDRDIFSLSSGERQLVALLTTLIMNPDILIFDEPSANLDYGNVMRLRKYLRELKESGKTVLVADHRFYYLTDLVDKVLYIKDRQIQVIESEQEFKSHDYGIRAFNIFENPFIRNNWVNSKEKVIHLEKIFFKDILKGISLEIFKGEITTIVGTNGAGKSTLARAMSSLIKVDKGTMDIRGRPLYIMQDADFQLFGATVLKELNITSKDEGKNLEVLQKLNLSHLKDQHPHLLSGGEKQRLQLAMAITSPHPIVILDEPTSGLDKVSMDRVSILLSELKKYKTVITISHDYEFIRNVSDRIIYMKNGEIKGNFLLKNEEEQLNKVFYEMEKEYEEQFKN